MDKCFLPSRSTVTCFLLLVLSCNTFPVSSESLSDWDWDSQEVASDSFEYEVVFNYNSFNVSGNELYEDEDVVAQEDKIVITHQEEEAIRRLLYDNPSKSIPISKYDDDIDEWFISSSIIFELLVYVCLAAGVFGICSFCCGICMHVFDARATTTSAGESGRPFTHYRVIQMPNGNDETGLTFIAIHRNPGMFNGENETFRFENDDYTDKPPSYEDLDHSKKWEGNSPPPPPYTPSFTFSIGRTEQETSADKSNSNF